MSENGTLDKILGALTQEVAQLLEIDNARVDRRKPFIEVGADSILLVRLIRFIERRFQISVPLRAFFEEQNTLERLAQFLSSSSPSQRDVVSNGVGHDNAVEPPADATRPGAADCREHSQSLPAVAAHGEKPMAVDRVKSIAPPAFDARADAPAPVDSTELAQLTRLFSSQVELLREQLQALSRVAAPARALELKRPHEDGAKATAQAGERPTTSNPSSNVSPPRAADVKAGFWARGRKESQQAPSVEASSESQLVEPRERLDFSLSYFGCYDRAFDAAKYRLLLDGARYADEHGFKAIWLPERHFHPLGGISPNPSVLAAALSQVSSRISLRAGSVVMPLHHPIRVAEEWAVVDNLSNGRVELALASGWHPDDFVLGTSSYEDRRRVTSEGAALLERLWRGDSVPFARSGSAGASQGTSDPAQTVSVSIFPQPIQPKLSLWLTVVNSPQSFVEAGKLGYGILTNLMGQTPEQLAANIRAYHSALAGAGFEGSQARVAVLLHTYLEPDADAARAAAKQPLLDYFGASVGLFQRLAKVQGLEADFDALGPDDRAFLFDQAFQRYLNGSALIGSAQSCASTIERLRSIGVTEIAALVDFGIDYERVMRSLAELAVLAQQQPDRAERTGAVHELASPASAGPATHASSPMQRQLWLLTRFGNGASAAYNESVAFGLRGELDVAALQAALEAVAARHESLRASLEGASGAIQRVRPSAEVSLVVTDISSANHGTAAAQLEALMMEETKREFDLARAPLFRARLIRVAPQEHVLLVTDHHIISDGWSMGVILRELGQLYSSSVEHAPTALAPAVQFSEFLAAAERARLCGKQEQDKQYWLRKLAAPLPVLELPVDFPRPKVKTYAGARFGMRLERPLVESLRQRGSARGCTLFMVVFAGYCAWLQRLTGQSDLVVGTPVANRDFAGAEHIVGCCLNLLPIRVPCDPDVSFGALLDEVRKQLLDAFDHTSCPFSEILDGLGAKRDVSRSPVISTMLTYNAHTIQAPRLAGLTTRIVAPPIQFAKYDQHLIVLEEDGELILNFDYNTDLFRPESVANMAGALRSILQSIASGRAVPVANLPLMSAAEAEQQIANLTGTRTDYPRESRLQEVFEHQVRLTPEAVAVEYEAERLTYAELNTRANRLARHLLERGVERAAPVGLCAFRSAEMLVGILGILKAGAAYVPLDPTLPEQRLLELVDDSAVALIVTAAGGFEEVLERSRPLVRLRDIPNEGVAPNPATEGAAEDLAYIMYTSGSTGTPKGVAVSHRNVLRVVKGTDYVTLTEADTLLQYAPFGFDGSTFEIFGSLLNGARLAVFGAGAGSIDELGAFIEARGVTTAWLTAGLFHLMVEHQLHRLGALRQLIAGGDVLLARHIQRFLSAHPRCRLINGYGPTEGTVFTCAHTFSPEDDLTGGVPIGRPISNTAIRILDERQQPTLSGMPGELYVAGDGVAMGYWRRPELTAQRFILDPLDANGTLYRTGDWVKQAPNGALLFIGRMDNQVKIRGFRVEIGEIETCLARHPAVAACVVVATPTPGSAIGEKRVIAYVVAADNIAPNVSELRRFVGESLPDFMVPSVVVFMDRLPLSANGKVDRSKLPAPESSRPRLDVKQVAPRDDVEAGIVELWKRLLGIAEVGVEDNFFDLGGTSLLLVEMHRELSAIVERELSLVEVLAHPTIASLVAHVQGVADPGASVNRARGRALTRRARRAGANGTENV